MRHPITTHMIDTRWQLTLQTWMSAAFPTGAFTCSHGMEQAISDGRVSDVLSCEDWISGIMQFGSGWNDAVLMTHAYAIVSAACEASEPTDSYSTQDKRWQDIHEPLERLNDLALALSAGAERLRETTQLGQAFSRAVCATTPHGAITKTLLDGDISLPVSIGASGALALIPAEQLIPASLQATSSNLVWICTRLLPLGQTQALQIISSLQPLIARLGMGALHSSLDDLGSSALLADLASMEHERLHSRICIT